MLIDFVCWVDLHRCSVIGVCVCVIGSDYCHGDLCVMLIFVFCVEGFMWYVGFMFMWGCVF